MKMVIPEIEQRADVKQSVVTLMSANLQALSCLIKLKQAHIFSGDPVNSLETFWCQCWKKAINLVPKVNSISFFKQKHD